MTQARQVGSRSPIDLEVGVMIPISDEQVWKAACTTVNLVPREDVVDMLDALGITNRVQDLLKTRDVGRLR